MANDSAATGRLAIGVTSSGRADGHVVRLVSNAAPLTLGVILPVLAILLIEPAALRHARYLMIFVLLPLFFMALLAYIFAVLTPGTIVGVTLDADRRQLELVQANAFSIKHITLPISDAARFRLKRNYDDDGYATDQATLELRDGQVHDLPTGISPDQIRSMNMMIGLIER